jgi:hypothetical protein
VPLEGEIEREYYGVTERKKDRERKREKVMGRNGSIN